MAADDKYWFPAKRRGWGWGLPNAWQGWLVLTAFGGLVLAGALVLLPTAGPAKFIAYCASLCILLVAVCWAKGERPRWRSHPQ